MSIHPPFSDEESPGPRPPANPRRHRPKQRPIPSPKTLAKLQRQLNAPLELRKRR
jgi:hypothetical protein